MNKDNIIQSDSPLDDAQRAVLDELRKGLDDVIAATPQSFAGLTLEARPPFSECNEVDPGDLSLLDPVRARGEVWRKVSCD